MEPKPIIWGKKLVPRRLHRSLRPIGRAWRECLLFRQTLSTGLSTILGSRPHGLPGQLVVSLTSYAPRFASLHRTLKCLLNQNVRPDRVILWIAHEDLVSLPSRVRKLTARGLDIRATEDLGSYKKLVPALREFPEAFIVTADDDVVYGPDWLKQLADGFDPANPAIICHRAHRPVFGTDGAVAPYRQWEMDVQDEAARHAAVDIVPTGCGGVLYYPGSLHPDVLDVDTFRTLCPTVDDFWFYWMARTQGSTFRKVGGRFRYLDWPGSQDRTLHRGNMKSGYDRQLAALVAEHPLGWPEGGTLERMQPEAPSCVA